MQSAGRRGCHPEALEAEFKQWDEQLAKASAGTAKPQQLPLGNLLFCRRP